MRHLVFAILALLACVASAADFQITGNSSGTISQLTVDAQVQVAPADVGKPGQIYIAAQLFGIWAFKPANGAWAVWNGLAPPPANIEATLGTHTFNIVDHLDLSGYPDIKFYVGYGTSFDDMALGGKYAAIPGAPTSNLVGTWVVLPGIVGDTFSFGAGMQMGSDGSFIYVDNCYANGSYVQAGQTLTLTVLGLKDNSDSQSCANPDHPVGSSLAIQVAASGDSMATYYGADRALWQRLPLPSGAPVGTWTISSITGNDFSSGETVTFNADGSLEHLDSPSDPGGCRAVGHYSISGNMLTATETSTGPTATGQCTDPPPPGQSITLVFSYDGTTLTMWHKHSMAIWQRSGG